MKREIKSHYIFGPGLISRHAIIISDTISFIFSFIAGGIIGYLFNEYIIDSEYFILSRKGEILQQFTIYSCLCLFGILSLHNSSRYDNLPGKKHNYTYILKIITSLIVIDITIQYFSAQPFSRAWLLGTWGASLLLIPLLEKTTCFLLSFFSTTKASAVIISEQEHTDPNQLTFIPKTWKNHINVTKHIKTSSNTVEEVSASAKAASRASNNPVIFIFHLDQNNTNKYEAAFNSLEKHKIPFYIFPDLGNITKNGLIQNIYYDESIMYISGNISLFQKRNRILKRIIDVIISLFAITITAPLILPIALFIKLDGGPIFYSHKRIGYQRKHLNCLKFRTMHQNANERLETILRTNTTLANQWKISRKLQNDPRITKVGAFLRKYSLDELPQLLNVLAGQMSLVGPRPVTAEELDTFYGDVDYVYTATVPGLTGLWQISGRSNTSFDERVLLDTRYARTWSILEDVRIILLTPYAVLSRDGAY